MSEEKKVEQKPIEATVKLAIPVWQYIVNVLMERPAKETMDLLLELKRQTDVQVAMTAKAAKAEAKVQEAVVTAIASKRKGKFSGA